jgi:DNA modification methylase
MPELRVTMTPTDELVPYAGNAKEHPEEQVAQIAESIREFGFNDPVGVWHDAEGRPVIIEGHGRVLAAQELGMDELPTIALDHLTDAQRRAYVHVHNQTTLTSGFDLEVLARELEELPEFDWAAYGFDVDELLEPVPDEPDEDELPDVPEEPRTKPGDLWLLGSHRLLCGDSTDPEQVARLMGDRRADLLLTDPPYNVAYHQNDGKGLDPKLAKQRTDRKVIQNDAFSDEMAFQRFIEDAMRAGISVMRPGAAWYVWFAAMHGPAVFGACADAGLQLRQELVWVKNHFTLGRSDYQWQHEPVLYGTLAGGPHYFAPTRAETTIMDDSVNLKKMSKAELRQMLEEILSPEQPTSVLRYDKPVASEEHPTMKPVPLFARLIRNSSRRGDAVLDLFGGSGTTAIACEQMGRDAYLMELDPAYCDVIVARWERLTGRRAKLAK